MENSNFYHKCTPKIETILTIDFEMALVGILILLENRSLVIPGTSKE